MHPARCLGQPRVAWGAARRRARRGVRGARTVASPPARRARGAVRTERHRPARRAAARLRPSRRRRRDRSSRLRVPAPARTSGGGQHPAASDEGPAEGRGRRGRAPTQRGRAASMSTAAGSARAAAPRFFLKKIFIFVSYLKHGIRRETPTKSNPQERPPAPSRATKRALLPPTRPRQNRGAEKRNESVARARAAKKGAGRAFFFCFSRPRFRSRAAHRSAGRAAGGGANTYGSTESGYPTPTRALHFDVASECGRFGLWRGRAGAPATCGRAEAARASNAGGGGENVEGLCLCGRARAAPPFWRRKPCVCA